MTGRRSASRGSATAEFAVALPGVVVILLAVLLAGTVGVAQISCQDSARVLARSAALGEEIGEPANGATASVGVDGGWVHVEVRREVRALGLGITVVGRAAALLEPTGSSP